jgi:hypothetical protein
LDVGDERAVLVGAGDAPYIHAYPDFSLGVAIKYLARLEPENGHLIVDLRQPVAARGKKRGK